MYILRAIAVLLLAQAVLAQQPTPIFPDPKLTPGDTFDVTAQDICVPVLGLEGVQDAEGNTLQEPPLPIWANFYQRALSPAIAEINAKTELRLRPNLWTAQSTGG